MHNELLTARLVADVHGQVAGTNMASLTVIMLDELLGRLRTSENAQFDADLLEAFLNAASPDWRDQLGESAAAGSCTDHDPRT
ncbi:hypothetical protein [Chitinimonas sp. BJB300]|uniref:hypothetical protein n=1 Tax=Chitinimonas sp. BJB300 TaxID=1559339 RepID=UPI000C0C7684|nr:hypothetical protein [Chitinimonas sp. BJB300]PHV09623.1 hypothetical protein CSQ89_20695 [Chitinimonas sp. BJB300]TSJ83011.1 hypothetical protein FG002_021810 [Chitinimonas sp. BJB300]